MAAAATNTATWTACPDGKASRTASGARGARSRVLAFSLPAFRGLSPRQGQLLCLTQVLGHLEMMPQCRKHLAGPVLQLRIFAAFGVALKQRHRILMGADLHGVEVGRKVLWLGIPQLVNLALRRAIESAGNYCLGVCGRYCLEVFRCLGVIGDHLVGESLLLSVPALSAELGGCHFSHVAQRDFLNEIGGRRAYAERGFR